MHDHEFGQTVRRWRDRATPAASGLPTGGHRRAAGLRREELAQLAGISVDYLTRLEQGRATSPSDQVVEALARALRLADAERELLFRLAGQRVPGPELVPQRIPPSVQRLLDRLATTPVVVYSAMWDLIDANAAYDALTGALSWRDIERNALWRHFLGPGPAAIHTADQLAEQQVDLVADLRLTKAKYPTDPRLDRLVANLSGGSPRFADLWEHRDLPTPNQSPRHKEFDHPEVGRIGLDCDTLVVTADDLRIMVYTAEPDSEDAERLTLATVLGSRRPPVTDVGPDLPRHSIGQDPGST